MINDWMIFFIIYYKDWTNILSLLKYFIKFIQDKDILKNKYTKGHSNLS